jgi:hypothetical protein
MTHIVHKSTDRRVFPQDSVNESELNAVSRIIDEQFHDAGQSLSVSISSHNSQKENSPMNNNLFIHVLLLHLFRFEFVSFTRENLPRKNDSSRARRRSVSR